MKSYFFLCLCFIFVSCTKVINFELPEDKNNFLVVEGTITSEKKQHKIILSRTTSYYDPQPKLGVTGADVSVSDGSNTYIFHDMNDGTYLSDTISFTPLRTYTLNIKLKSGESYTAQEYMDKVASIDSISYKKTNDPFHPSRKVYELYLWAQEDPEQGDYYLWNFYVNYEWINNDLNELSFTHDEFINGSYINGLKIYDLDTTLIINDSNYVKVDMLSISKGYYNFIIAAMLETDWRGGPFDGPPANVPTNLSNGAIGYFSASDVSSYTFWITKK